ncbi:MAG: Arm DNA-binding domain-containing protein [Actinomycetota bacterium]|nr:Arm DNA-binding domain-containing protein [Actinomycetota bacterium]
MRGSVVKRGKSWSVVVDTGNDPLTGRRRQRWHGGHRTKRDAEAALAEIVGSVNKRLCTEVEADPGRVHGGLAGRDRADTQTSDELLLRPQPSAARLAVPRRDSTGRH